MEDQTQKVISLQEEIISLQKTTYNNSLQMVRKINTYRQVIAALLVITLVSLLYALIMSVLYYHWWR